METGSRFLRQMKKGILEMLVLELLSQSPGYGYQLLTRLSRAPGGTLLLKEGTLYPILYRLEEEGLLCSGWQPGQGRTAPRKIYTITEKGLDTLSLQRRLWESFQQDIRFIQEDEIP